jgi:outer membrane cobalamin receptor
VFLKDCCILSVFICSTAYCQSGADSLHHVVAPPIIITSDAYSNEILIHPSDIQTQTSVQLAQQSGANRLAEAIPIIHPSLDVRNYGALGGVSFASFRGLPAEYTSVYWEGIKITNSQNSLSDLALIDLNSIQTIGVVSAANAQLISGDIGGVGILLNTDSYHQPLGIDISTSSSSFDDLSTFGENQMSIKGKAKLMDSLSFSGGITDGYSNGAFPFFQPTTGNIVRRENNAAHLFNANAGADYIIDDAASIKAFSFFTRADRGAPGAVTIDNRGASDFNAHQFDEDFLGALSIKDQPKPFFGYTVTLGYQSQYETYDLPSFSVADKYLNRIYSFVLKSKTNISTSSDLFAGIDYAKNALFSNENSASKSDTGINREAYSAYLAYTYRFTDNFDATGSLREELQSDINKLQTLPGISLYYTELHTLLQLQASYGNIYHAPTFNELYWRVGGNQNLVPETGTSAEISGSIPVFLSQLLTGNIKITAYHSDMNNQIIWQPSSNNIWTPSNVKSSRSQGIEATAELRYFFAQKYSVLLHEAINRGEATNRSSDSSYFGKELPYSTPLRSFFLVEFGHASIGSLSFSLLYRWHRYTDFYNNESTRLPAVAKLDLILSSVPIHIADVGSAALRLSLLNFTNTQYDEIPNYPLPGRTIRFSLDFHFL